jgi:hypothetical protein
MKNYQFWTGIRICPGYHPGFIKSWPSSTEKSECLRLWKIIVDSVLDIGEFWKSGSQHCLKPSPVTLPMWHPCLMFINVCCIFCLGTCRLQYHFTNCQKILLMWILTVYNAIVCCVSWVHELLFANYFIGHFQSFWPLNNSVTLVIAICRWPLEFLKVWGLREWSFWMSFLIR